MASRREGFFWVGNRCVANLEVIDGVLMEILRKFSLRLSVLITDMGFVLKRFSQHHLSSFFIKLLLDKVFCHKQDYMNIRSKCQLNGVVFENLQTFQKLRDCKRSNAYETGGLTR